MGFMVLELEELEELEVTEEREWIELDMELIPN
jgi:hypothetical protein